MAYVYTRKYGTGGTSTYSTQSSLSKASGYWYTDFNKIMATGEEFNKDGYRYRITGAGTAVSIGYAT